MLQHEITPFADYHIEQLKEVRATVQKARDAVDSNQELDHHLDQLTGAINALVRFKVCMEDESKQKLRYAKTALNCRVNHRDL